MHKLKHIVIRKGTLFFILASLQRTLALCRVNHKVTRNIFKNMKTFR